MIIGDPYEGKVISWATDRTAKLMLDNAYTIDAILADFQRRIIAIMKNRNPAIPDITNESNII